MDPRSYSQLKKLIDARIIIIRHANSTFNYKWEKVEEEVSQGKSTQDKFLEVIQDPNLLDCPLSELGVQQCNESQKLANQLKEVKTIFISPLRRSLQTAYQIFKSHPNFTSINFVVHPVLRENLHTICDIPESIDVVKAEYQKLIPHMDFSLIDKRENSKLWYYQDLQEPIRSKLLQRYERDMKNKNEKDIVLEEVIKTYPDRLESAKNTYDRREEFKSFILDFISSKPIEEIGQIMVVGHSQYFSHLTATQWPKKENSQEFDYTQAPTKFRWLKNCEFYPIDDLILLNKLQ